MSSPENPADFSKLAGTPRNIAIREDTVLPEIESAPGHETTNRIIGAAFVVANALGSGFLEKVYENALVHELKKSGLSVEQQKPVRIIYDGIVVGEYVADLVVQGSVIVELKAVKALDEIHMAQCLNYLKATGLRVCLLINFGTPRLQIKRLIYGY